MSFWFAIYLCAVIALIWFGEGDEDNEVWDSATAGLMIGLVLGFFIGSSYWLVVLRATSIGALVGLVYELAEMDKKNRGLA